MDELTRLKEMDGHYIQIMKKGFICHYGECEDAIGITIANKDGDILYHASFKDPLSREEVISNLDNYISTHKAVYKLRNKE